MSKLNTAIFLVAALSLVSCGDDSSGSGSASGGGGTSYKKIYLASISAPTGDLGIADIDAACNSGYRAMVGGNGRHPDVASSGAVDWVLSANTEYRRNDGVTVIGTTTAAAIFSFPLTNSFSATSGKYYTGLSTTWSTSDAISCQDWGSMADDRTYGDALSVTTSAIAEGMHDCGTSGPAAYVVCVEQ